ncbi:MAG: hypothetical protein ACP5KN_01210, partial [Armatimonadota bacterium]
LVQSLRAEAPEAFEQADLYERTLTVLAFPGDPPYVVDVFRVRGGQRSLMAFHGDGETFASTARYVPYDGRFITEAAEGGDWIRTCERAEAPGAFSATWRIEPENELGVRLTVLDAPAAAYHITAPGLRNRRTPWADRTLHVLLWEQAGSEPVFVSVAEAVRGEPRLGSIERVACSPAGAVGVRVQREGAMDYTFVADGDAATSEVRAELPEGLSFRGREAVVSVGETGPAYARLVDGTELRLGDLSLSCPGPMSGEIAAFDDEADTITTAAELPGGEALRGQQLLVGGHVDGAYEIARVKRTETASVVHLAREPIMQVEAGDTFAISSIVEARRLDDGTWEVRADCPLQAELPRPADVNSRVMLRTPEGWQRLAHENADGVVRVRIDPEALEGGPAVLLITDGGIDLSDVRPPAVGAVRVDGEVLARGADVDLGYVQEPRVVAVELQDAANAISTAAFAARISGDPAAKIDAGLYRRDADGRSARAIVRLRELPPAQYTVRLHFCDRAANSGEAVVRFNTRGHVLRATELPVVADSGRLSKPLGGLDTQFYRSQEPGDWVEYAFETPQSATYEVTLVATGYESYGTYQVSIDGRDLGEPVDAFRRDLDVAGITESLGTLRLGAGPHRMRLTTVGNNEQSQDYYIGWHSLVLRPVSDD